MNKTYTILIADDDVDDQELIKEALNSLGEQFEIVTLHNGLQIMDFLLKRNSYKHIKVNPDLIFLDLNMPFMDGYDVLRHIRTQQSLASLPIYVITLSRNTGDKSKALDLGATGFYHKGTQVSDIAYIVKDVLSKTFVIPGLQYL